MSTKKNVELLKTETQMQAQKPETVIYMGPTIKNVAMQGTVFEGGIPPELEEMGIEIRAVEALVIPVKDLPKANRELAAEGSALNVLYKKAEERIAKLHLQG